MSACQKPSTNVVRTGLNNGRPIDAGRVSKNGESIDVSTRADGLDRRGRGYRRALPVGRPKQLSGRDLAADFLPLTQPVRSREL